MKTPEYKKKDWRDSKQVYSRYTTKIISSNEQFGQNEQKPASADYLKTRKRQKPQKANKSDISNRKVFNDNSSDIAWNQEHIIHETPQNIIRNRAADYYSDDEQFGMECTNEWNYGEPAAKSREKQKRGKPDKTREGTKANEYRHTKMNLNSMADEILRRVQIINHDGNLYRYTGSSYKIIKNEDELLSLIRSHISFDAFGISSVKQFQDLLAFLKADPRLIPDNYDKKIRESQYYIAFRNGVLDIRTLELYEHSKKYLVFYELDADWEEGAHPKKFLKFIKQASGHDEFVMKRMRQ